MLERGYQNLVAGFHPRPGIRIHHEVNRFRCSANENNFAFASCVDELFHNGSCVFIGFRRAVTQRVHSTMDIRTIGCIKPIQGFDHRLRLLCCCGVVQIDKRFPMHLLVETRKILSDCQQVKLSRFHSAQRTHAFNASRSHSLKRCSNSSRSVGMRMASIISPANPRTRIRFASPSSIPRLLR